MKLSTITAFALIILGATLFLGQIKPSQAAPLMDPKTPTPTRAGTATPDAVMQAKIILLYGQATDTQIAIAKTEQADRDARATLAQAAVLHELDMTNQAYASMMQTSSAATATHGAEMAIATITSGAGTAQATMTYGAMTAGANLTVTSIASTQVIENNKRNATIALIWLPIVLLFFAGILGLAFLAVKVWKSWKLGKAEYIQASKIEPDAQGRLPLPNTDALGKDNKLINPNLAHRAVIDPTKDDLSTEQALANTQSNRVLEATRAMSQSPALMRSIGRQQAKPEKEPELPQANMTIQNPSVPLLMNNQILTPSWSMIEDWDGKNGIPYGVSAHGMELLSLVDVPHGGVFGKTGKGKSRYFLRPFIAGAIAAGHRVVILGKQADFWPFAQHANVTMIPVRHITQIEEAERYAEYLKRIVIEMNRRDDYLTSSHVSTWDRAGRENTLIILDELGNALDMMPKPIRDEALRWVQGLSKEGRKAGFNIWLATQRAVGLKSIVEQLGRAVFHLADAEASRFALGFPGAEELSDGYFFAKFKRLNKCAAFDPTDDELVKFLLQRQVRLHEPIDWIEGEVAEDKKPVPAVEKTFTVSSQPVDEIAQMAESIRAQWRPDMSKSEVSRLLGRPYSGPSWCAKVNQVIDYLSSSTSSSTEKMPDSGLLPA